MGIIEDTVKVLERIPIWKRLNALPAEVEALTKRVQELEARLAPASGSKCPSCSAMAYKLIESRPSPPPWGDLGARQLVYRCGQCSFEDVQERNPGG